MKNKKDTRGSESYYDGFDFEEVFCGIKTKENGKQHRKVELNEHCKSDVISVCKNYDGYSIKNSSTPSTQLHLTSQSSFCNDIGNVPDSVSEFIRLFFGIPDRVNNTIEYVKEKYKITNLTSSEIRHNRLWANHIPPNLVEDALLFFNRNKIPIAKRILSGKETDKYKANKFIWADKNGNFIECSIKDILDACNSGKWEMSPRQTTLWFEINSGKLFRCQMKGSPSVDVYKSGYHSMQFHIYKKALLPFS